LAPRRLPLRPGASLVRRSHLAVLAASWSADAGHRPFDRTVTSLGLAPRSRV
jgi:hypothetical protein